MTGPTRRTVALGIGALLAGTALPRPLRAAPAFAAPARIGSAVEAGGSVFGTYWRVLAAGSASLSHGSLHDLATEAFEVIDRAMSPFLMSSELSRINRSDDSGPIALGAELCTVTAAALRVAAASKGAFDPTVGPMVARAGFGPIHGGGAPDWTGLALTLDGLIRNRADLTLDLCGIAKGRAIDRLGQRLAALGVRDWLIDLGGELRVSGRHPAGRDWRTAITRPFGSEGEAIAALWLRDQAIATSGVGEQSYRLADGSRGSHLIDPATGDPIRSGLLSVSVIAPTAMEADAWATALAVMGPDTGAAFAQGRDLSACFLRDTTEGPSVRMTGGFAAHLLA